MLGLVETIGQTTVATLRDVTPIVAILFGFQWLVLRRRPPNLKRIATGFVYVLLGLTLFLVGLEEALFPLGETMARQLAAQAMIGAESGLGTGSGTGPGTDLDWRDYVWVYVFAAAIGFATTVAEPALIAVSLKAQEVSGGALDARGLRMAVAVGVAVGVALGAYRIVSGTPLQYYIIIGYLVVVIQTWKTAKAVVPLAYDSGGVTTSTVTVPVVTALGLGLASTIPGRSPLIDGFGLIAFASLFPIMSVMGYAMLTDWRRRRSGARSSETET
jgi:hypothetical protein